MQVDLAVEGMREVGGGWWWWWGGGTTSNAETAKCATLPSMCKLLETELNGLGQKTHLVQP